MKIIHPSSKNGQSMVEMALLLPILLLISVFVIDLGRGVYYYSVLYNAAREGARWAIVNQQPGNTSPLDSGAILTESKKLAIGLDQTQIKFPKNEPPSINGDMLTVKLEYTFRLVTPITEVFIKDNEIKLTSSSTMLIER